jgi:hypothetical protein
MTANSAIGARSIQNTHFAPVGAFTLSAGTRPTNKNSLSGTRCLSPDNCLCKLTFTAFQNCTDSRAAANYQLNYYRLYSKEQYGLLSKHTYTVYQVS